MKKVISIITAISMFTACGTEVEEISITTYSTEGKVTKLTENLELKGENVCLPKC